jgi:hypothetical protein
MVKPATPVIPAYVASSRDDPASIATFPSRLCSSHKPHGSHHAIVVNRIGPSTDSQTEVEIHFNFIIADVIV